MCEGEKVREDSDARGEPKLNEGARRAEVVKVRVPIGVQEVGSLEVREYTEATTKRAVLRRRDTTGSEVDDVA